jgi:hypothetical protein
MNARQERRERAGREAMLLWDTMVVCQKGNVKDPFKSPKTKAARAAAFRRLSDIHKGIFGKGIGRTNKVQPMLRTLDVWVKGDTDATLDDATLVYSILDILRMQANESASFDAHNRRGVSRKDILADAVSLSVDYRTGDDVTDPSMGNTSNAWHARAWERMGETREDCMSPLDILIRREEEDALRVCAADVA